MVLDYIDLANRCPDRVALLRNVQPLRKSRFEAGADEQESRYLVHHVTDRPRHVLLGAQETFVVRMHSLCCFSLSTWPASAPNSS